MGGKWVYAVKKNSDGTDKYKTRHDVNYDKTFSPTASMTSIRVLAQKAAQNDLIVHQMDVKTAYLHAPIEHKIYSEQREGYEVQSKGNGKLLCKLKKSLYGLKQSGRNWNKMLHDYLCEMFVQKSADHCVYSKITDKEKVHIIIWVDDLIIAASDDDVLRCVKEMLKSKFRMKDLGKLTHFLGIDFEQSSDCVIMQICTENAGKVHMLDCKLRATPCAQKLDYSDDAEEMIDVTKYREAVGSLIYLATCTRPDLSFVVSKLSQYFAKPTAEQWTTVKHALRYLK